MKKSESLKLLKQVREQYPQATVAGRLGVDRRTVRRWEMRETEPPAYLGDAIRQRFLLAPDASPVSASRFTFIDLFAGIGGTRLGFEKHGGRCVYTSEWNRFSRLTYEENFGSDPEHRFDGDITKVEADEIPDHDILVAGFPCQPFSIAGVSKKRALGMPDGFECKTQGTLFFDVARIIKAKRPKAFLLENVKNLLSHDKGTTFRVILETLESELGYDVHYRVIDGGHFVPQHRERIIIVGFKTDRFRSPGRISSSPVRDRCFQASCIRKTGAKGQSRRIPLA
jgi:DNA (cytosine-5)-methyltransferase 1